MEAKKIIVTGGANRIGRSIALELASYDTQIVIHYSKSYFAAKKLKKELENLGSVVYLFKADLNNFRQTQKIISYAYKKMKGLDCLINNASVFENDNLINFSDKAFLKHINVNLKAPAILIRDFPGKLSSSTFCVIPRLSITVGKMSTKLTGVFIFLDFGISGPVIIIGTPADSSNIVLLAHIPLIPSASPWSDV